MNAFAWVAIGIAAGALLPLLFRRRQPALDSAADAPARIPAPPADDYSAVEIRPGTGACAQAREQVGQRYLAPAAPALPLPECSAAQCRCRYAKHADRRSGDDRRLGLMGAAGGLLVNAHGDRRRPRAGRRQDDRLD